MRPHFCLTFGFVGISTPYGLEQSSDQTVPHPRPVWLKCRSAERTRVHPPLCMVAELVSEVARAMALMNEEQLMQLIVRAVTTAVGAAQAAAVPVPGAGGRAVGGGAGGVGAGRVLKEKGFAEVPKLSKGQEQWTDWSYDLRIAMATMSPEMRRTIDVIQDMPQELDLASATALDPERAERINLPLRSAELFQILVLKTDGEAKLLVKSVQGEDGLRAWQLLRKHYHRKTFAKAIKDHREVLYPR